MLSGQQAVKDKEIVLKIKETERDRKKDRETNKQTNKQRQKEE
jgi:hypothetical protein